MVQLQHIDVANGNRTVEHFARLAVIECHLARCVQSGIAEHFGNVFLPRAIKHRRSDRNTTAQVLRRLHQFAVIKGIELVVLAVDLEQAVTQRLDLLGFLIGIKHLAHLLAKARTGPAQMGFQDLAHVHAARHTKRVQNNINMGAILKERHVFDGHDARNHALVAVASSHLVAGLNLPLHRDEDFDHLHHARRQLISPAANLVKKRFQDASGFVILQLHGFEFGNGFLGG
jgi:hypothetical protein